MFQLAVACSKKVSDKITLQPSQWVQEIRTRDYLTQLQFKRPIQPDQSILINGEMKEELKFLLQPNALVLGLRVCTQALAVSPLTALVLGITKVHLAKYLFYWNIFSTFNQLHYRGKCFYSNFLD